MKKFLISLLIVIPFISFGQYDGSTLHGLFFDRQPSARAEAMGRSYSSIDGDLASVFFNPAGIANIKELELNGSISDPNYPFLHKVKYYFTSIGYKFNKYLIMGITRNRFTFGEQIDFADDFGNIIGTYLVYNTKYALTLSSQPLKNLFIGINTNYYSEHTLAKVKPLFYFDFGLIKKFQFIQNKANEQSLSIGASITNLNSSKITYDYNGILYTGNLPIITRYGANYQFSISKPLLNDSLKTLQFLFQGEYQMLLNYKYIRGFHAGGEITFLELLCFRAGYYNENIDTQNYPSNEIRNKIDVFTYGLGFQIPIHKLTKVPLNIIFDYAKLPKATYYYNNTSAYFEPYNTDKFTTYNIRINWIFKK